MLLGMYLFNQVWWISEDIKRSGTQPQPQRIEYLMSYCKPGRYMNVYTPTHTIFHQF